MGRKRQWRWAERSFWLVGAFALSYCGFIWLDAQYAQWRGDLVLRDLEQQHATPFRRAHTGDVVGRLEIAHAGLSAVVFEGTDNATLARGVGHLSSSAPPGKTGNVVLAAHRDTFFRSLEYAKRGDLVTFTTPSGATRYTVDSIEVVNPDDTYVLRPTSAATITLITCYPFRFVGNAPKRYVVRGEAFPATRSETRVSVRKVSVQ